MNNHYYSENPESSHEEKLIKVTLFNKEFKFKTDSGVFSKNRIDYGSLLLINNLDLDKSSKLLDMGCGYGPIGIVASALLYEGQVDLVDINERAIELAKDNIKINKNSINTNVIVNVQKSKGFENIVEKNYDVILLNPPIRAGKQVIFQMYQDAYEHLNNNGRLYVVIQKKQGAPSTLKKLQSIFTSVLEIDRKRGYYIYKCNK